MCVSWHRFVLLRIPFRMVSSIGWSGTSGQDRFLLQSTLLRVGHSSPVDVRKLRDEKQQQLQFHFVFKCIAYKFSKFNLSSSLSLLLPFYLPY